MAPTKHATFSASSSSRLLSCPASYALGLAADDGTRKSSVYSAEGTLAHSISEVCVFTGRNPEDFIGETKHADGFTFTIDEDFAMHVRTYVDTLRGLRAMGYVMALERQVSPQIHWDGLPPLMDLSGKQEMDLFGTGDCVAYHPHLRTLIIGDLKFGAGVPVEVAGNTQLLYYGAGCAHEDVLKPICDKAGVPYNGVDKVVLMIVQPRAFHVDGPVRRAEYTYDEVRTWARETLYQGVERAVEDNGKTLADGKHCRWCPVLPHCQKPRDTAFNTARAAFLDAPLENIPAPDDPGAALPDVHLTDAKLGELLDKVEIITPWIAALKELAQKRAQENRQVPGWKLVPKRALRQWTDAPSEIIKELERNGVDVSRITETKLLSPAQSEKRLGKADYDAFVAPLVGKNSSGSTLVPDGDPRQRIKQRTGADAFKNAP